MASPRKPSLEENRITESGWTFPADVVGELPPPRPESDVDCEREADWAWAASIKDWVGSKFAVLVPGLGWSTGQEDLFSEGGTAPSGSWPKRVFMGGMGRQETAAVDVRPWPPRPLQDSPRSGSSGPGEELFSTPTASTSTGADMVQALFTGGGGGRPSYEEASRIFVEGHPGIWRTPSARDFKGADPKNATGRQVGLNDQVKKDGLLYPTPAASRRSNEGSVGMYRAMVKAGRISREEAARIVGKDVFESQGKIPREEWDGTIVPVGRGDGKLFATPQHHDAVSGDAKRVGRFGTDAGGRNLNDEVLAFPGPQRLLPTPTSNDGDKPRGPASRQHDLQGVARGYWPTPRANDAEKRGAIDTENPRNGLPGRVLGNPGILPTPMSRDFRSGKASQETLSGNSRPLNEVVQDGEGQRALGQLNPDWVDVLMGYPLGTTRLHPDAVGWFSIDSRRLKAADLKRLHAMDEAEDPEGDSGEDR